VHAVLSSVVKLGHSKSVIYNERHLHKLSASLNTDLAASPKEDQDGVLGVALDGREQLKFERGICGKLYMHYHPLQKV
jgi:hypothetical protein